MSNTVASFSAARPPIDALTSLRGVAAILVVCHHMGLLMLPLRGTALGPALQNLGVLGMTTFFVLSGFVIHYNYAERLAVERKRAVFAFLFARFARLYPLYLPVILLNFVLNFSTAALAGNAAAVNAYVAALPVNLTGMQTWVYATFNGINLTNAQVYANNSWSISVEFMLYLLFVPIAMWGGFKRNSLLRGILITLAAIILRIVFIGMATDEAVVQGINRIWGEPHGLDPTSWLAYYSPYGRFFEFLAGVGIAEIWLSALGHAQGERVRRVAQWCGAVALLYVAGSLLNVSLQSAPQLFTGYRLFVGYAVAVPLVIYALCQSRGVMSKWVTAAPLLLLGEMSYSVYMLHGNLFPLFRLAPGGDIQAQVLQMVWRALAFLVLVFVSSWLTYRYLEMPARRWIMDFYRKGMSTTT